MKFKNLAVQMAERGYSVSAWGRSRGLSDNDIYILRELCKNAMKGVWGRGAELRKILEDEGFDTSFLDDCEMAYSAEAVVVG